MSDDRVRFTAWLSRSEKDALTNRARQYGSSENFVMRTALRQYLGFDNADTQESVPERDLKPA